MKRIHVVLPTSTLTQRQLLEGLLAYAHDKPGDRWQLQLDLHDLNRQHMRNLKSWNCQGVIAYILSARERRDFIATGLPAVFVEPTLSRPLARQPRNVATFINDHAEEGRTAARYFMERRYRSFAYIGTAKPTFWSDERLNGFSEQLASGGFRPCIYPIPPLKAQNDFALESRILTQWLRRLPKPTALFCVHDRRAQQVIATALSADLNVPNDLAVLGVDNDELLCNMTVPSISSIPVSYHEQGRLVGETLEALILHRKTERVFVSRHTSVITRRSTDANAILDAFVARAVAYLQTHLQDRPTLYEIAAAAGCSNTELARRTRIEFGHSLGEEKTRMQLSLAVDMLRNTSKTVDDIAKSCGFCGASHLGLRFKAVLGKSPKSFRP